MSFLPLLLGGGASQLVCLVVVVVLGMIFQNFSGDESGCMKNRSPFKVDNSRYHFAGKSTQLVVT